jgi:hypothetical protein
MMLANQLSKTQEEIEGTILEQDRVLLGGENYAPPENTLLEQDSILFRGS